jgi:phage shock protein PspC (stress-responsive transcriptional regulator)
MTLTAMRPTAQGIPRFHCRRAAATMVAMTTERARRAADPSPPRTVAPRLRRRASDRVIGGVAGGIADYLNVDPLLIRAAFVGLMIFGAAGLFIYLVVWLVVPVEGSEESVLEAALQRVGIRRSSIGTLGWLVLGLVAAIVFFQMQAMTAPYGYYPSFIDPRFLIALVVIVSGIMFMRRAAAREDPAAVASATTAPAVPAERVPARHVRIRKPRERSPLPLYTIGALLLVFGLVAAADGLTETEILPGIYAGAVLSTIGIGLVVGAWWGRARWLIAAGILLVPIAIVASVITAPLQGGWGDHWTAPSSAAELHDEYRLAGGRLTLDLRDLPRSAADRRITASVGIGQLVVIAPPLAGLDIRAEVGAGGTWILGAYEGPGTEIEGLRLAGGSAGTYTLDLEVGIGEVMVERMPESPR